jgi:predicted anti-sigma-YlaC factor YlaD
VTGPADLTCKELVELATDYLEGTLPEPDRVRLEAHLEVCEGCRNYLEQMRRTISISGLLTEEEIPPEGRDDLLRAFQAWLDSQT